MEGPFLTIEGARTIIEAVLRDRLMAGHRPLEPSIEVRVLVPEIAVRSFGAGV